MIYLDHNATSPLRPEAKAAVERVLSLTGNPSSVHAAGRAARAVIEGARDEVAVFCGARPQSVVFTSGGTEANVHALFGAVAGAQQQGARVTRLFVAATVHSSVVGAVERLAENVAGLKVCRIAVDANGRIDLDAFCMQLMNDKGRALVSLIHANNETGVIEDVKALENLIRHAAGDTTLLHVDCVASGHSTIACGDWNADYVSLSAHKIGGPQGAGALIVKDGAPLAPLIPGMQEMRRRGGTENVSGIAGFGSAAAALRANRDVEARRIARMRDRFEAALVENSPKTIVFGAAAARQANVSCFALPALPAETALMALDLDGIAVSSGAACSSGKVSPSHVLAAMGVPEPVARCALRVSLGWSTTEAEIDAAIGSLNTLLARKRALAAA